MAGVTVRRRGEARFEIDPTGAMRVPGVVFASPACLPDDGGETLEQVANVATLPGIVAGSYAMPDLHLGYGFPIGGVAATDVDEGGVVSPGGVGFDISCGVRVLAAPLARDEVGDGAFETLMGHLDRGVPRGTGPGGLWEVADRAALRRVLAGGAAHAVECGYGTSEDLEHTEDRGRLPDADVDGVSAKALDRGLRQVGSLGGGNHFLEVQVVDRVVDSDAAAAFGVRRGQLTVMIHSGSRGLGHQVCADHVRAMDAGMRRHGIQVPDRQLACMPVDSEQGRAYLGGMAAAANYGRANRQVLAEAARDAFGAAFGDRGLRLVYDVSHNMAKLEPHEVAGRRRVLCVHRKGATLALPPGHPDLPPAYRASGQPVAVPGSMGTASWLLAGAGGEGFASTCHGAGRTHSRRAARKRVRGGTLNEELARRGIAVRALSARGLAEEAPTAYKDVDEVVGVCETAGLSRRVARLRPLGVVKG
ncbi:MAG: RtcB family protein [Actinomycetota bacterium]|nr:RtcB family protein [Actinomycetota bacterium]